MKRVGAGIAMIVVTLTLMTSPAAAQNGSAWLTPKNPEPLESSREVVLTVTMWRAGRVAYRTFDGACDVDYSRGGEARPPSATCSESRKARAPEDYSATSGELVFTAGGSKSIRIPIVDDAVADGGEAFTVAAWEEANADPWLPRGDSVIVNISDDEVDPSGGNSAAPAAGSATNTRPAAGQSSGSPVGSPARTSPQAPRTGLTADPATTTTAMPPPGLQAALPDGDLRPGPGFELTSEGAPEPAAERGGGAGGSAAGLAIGAGTAVLGVGALAVMRRRRRWSPTQA